MQLLSVLFILNVQGSDICQAAIRHNVDCETLQRIVMVESSGHTYAFNKKSLDYGVAQIHYKTALAYKMDVPRLLTDRAYNLDRAAFILSTYKRRYMKREPATWQCRYHIGTGDLTKLSDRCDNYLKKLGRVK